MPQPVCSVGCQKSWAPGQVIFSEKKKEKQRNISILQTCRICTKILDLIEIPVTSRECSVTLLSDELQICRVVINKAISPKLSRVTCNPVILDGNHLSITNDSGTFGPEETQGRSLTAIPMALCTHENRSSKRFN